MKYFLFLMATLMLVSCSSTKLLGNWKNPSIENYTVNKVLIVGMTPNVEARLQFEQQIKNNLQLRGINATSSLDLFDASLRTEKMTKEALKTLKNKLTNEGFDAVLFSKVIGVEDKMAFNKSYYNYKKTTRSFNDDYFSNQDIYYNPKYYENYTVYHAETSLYCVCRTKESELIWKGYIDITNPKSIKETVDDYTKLILSILEKESLISKKITDKKY